MTREPTGRGRAATEVSAPRQRGLHDWAVGRPTDTEDLVRAIAVTTAFGDRVVLNGIDLAARRGEILVLMGPSGCGKTTMLRHLCGLQQPTLGSVYVCGHDVYGLPPDRLHDLRLRTGMAFQGGALLGGLTVAENVALPIVENALGKELPKSVVRQMVRARLDMVGMLHAADQLPASLSGGMKKRAAIARALALDPDILFLDEPTSGLDPVTAAGIDRLVLRLNRAFGITTMVVTHDIASARLIADRVVIFLDGRIAAVGSHEEVLESGSAITDPRVHDFLERRLVDAAVTPTPVGGDDVGHDNAG